MLITIDVGNSSVVLGLFEDPAAGKAPPNLLKTFRLSTHPLVTGDEFRATLSTLLKLEGIEPTAVRSAILSSVVPALNPVIRDAFKGRVPLHTIDSQWNFSFDIAAHPAEQIGADRLVNAEAAVREFGSPCIVIDSGTATTLCAIAAPSGPGARPRYLGGAITPGLELATESLARRAAKLFSVELAAPAHAIGTNTVEAIRSGTLLGYASLIDGMVARFREEMGSPQAQVIATGGASRLLRGVCRTVDHWEDHLTLRGLAYLGQAR